MKAFFNLEPGVRVSDGTKRYVISHILSLESVLGKDEETGTSKQINITDIKPIVSSDQGEETTREDISQIKDEDWEEAEQWYALIHPLLTAVRRTTAMVKEVATIAGVHIATIYRKIDDFQKSGLVSSLCPSKSDGGKGASRLNADIEAIIQASIKEVKQKKSTKKIIAKVEEKCRNAELEPPHPNTIRNRIRAAKEEAAQEARRKHPMHPDHFPGADWPLAVVQIDHTKLDLMIVDDVDRQVIGRPWITVAIDVFSRMVVGFYLSLDPPGSMSAGLCLVHSILPKDGWLAKLGVSIPWPCWGPIRKIHADNAGEFRGNMLKRACKEYGMGLEFRPVKKPNYGGHIERLLGTLAKEIHDLPGTTLSNPSQLGDYKPEQFATMTFSELERWLTIFITGVYHQRVHSALLTSPIKRYEQGVFGTDEMPGRGLPVRITNEDRLRLDLMPYEERTIQDYGVLIDGVKYYSDVLRKYANAQDPDNPRRKLKFLFRRDSRNISAMYFYDPQIKDYFIIPYRNISHPAISIWEFRAARQRLVDLGVKDIDEDLIFNSYEQMRAIEEESQRKGKETRRNEQRRRNNQQATRPKTTGAQQEHNSASAPVDLSVLPVITPYGKDEV